MFAALTASAAVRMVLRLRRRSVLLLLTICVTLTTLDAQATAQAPAKGLSPATHVARGLSVEPVRASLTFEPNLGQDKSAAPYVAYGPGYLLRLEATRATVAFDSHGRSQAAASFALAFAGSNPQAKLTGAERQPGTHSYFSTPDRGGWLPNVPTYARVNYAGLYPGVDLSFYGKERSLEYDLIVQPEADARPIQIKLDGAERVHVDADGNLSMVAGGSALTLRKPVAYQLAADGVRREAVEAHYRLGHDNAAELSFVLGTYDHERPLIIDPVLVYGVDIPGVEGYSYPPYYFADTVISAMTVDAVGNAYVAATVSSSNADYSVMKFDPSGHLVYNVSLGSSGVYASVQSIAADAAGNVYLAGSASPGLPTTANAYER